MLGQKNVSAVEAISGGWPSYSASRGTHQRSHRQSSNSSEKSHERDFRGVDQAKLKANRGSGTFPDRQERQKHTELTRHSFRRHEKSPAEQQHKKQGKRGD